MSAWAAIALPAIAALLLAAAPGLGWLHRAAAALTLLATLAMAWEPPPPGLLAATPLARALAPQLALLVLLLPPGRAALTQAMLAAAMLALLAGPWPLLLGGLVAAAWLWTHAAAAPREPAAEQQPRAAAAMLPAAGGALALSGIALLHAGVPPLGTLLLVLGLGALAGLAPWHAGPARAGAAHAGLALLLPLPAMLGLARLDLAGLAGAALAGMGLLSVALAAAALWRARTPQALLGGAGLLHLGLAALALGLGEPGRPAAGLLLAGLPLVLGAAMLAPRGPSLAVALGAAALLPPLLPFAGLAALLAAVARAEPWLLALLLPGLVAGMLALARAAQSALRAGGPVSLPALLLLGLSLAGGLAMPAGIGALLQAAPPPAAAPVAP